MTEPFAHEWCLFTIFSPSKEKLQHCIMLILNQDKSKKHQFYNSCLLLPHHYMFPLANPLSGAPTPLWEFLLYEMIAQTVLKGGGCLWGLCCPLQAMAVSVSRDLTVEVLEDVNAVKLSDRQQALRAAIRRGEPKSLGVSAHFFRPLTLSLSLNGGVMWKREFWFVLVPVCAPTLF